MAIAPTQLSVKTSEGTADTVAAAIWDFAQAMPVTTARDASTKRMLLRHAEEIVSLHDTLDAKVVLATPERSVAAVPENGYRPEPAYANES